MSGPLSPVAKSDIERILHLIQQKFEEKKARKGESPVLLVAVAGVPAAGKSTFAEYLVDQLHLCEALRNEALKGNSSASNFATHFSMDGYHLFRSELQRMPNSEEAFARRGAEWTFDVEKLYSHLTQLKNVGELMAPSFDHAVKDPVLDSIVVSALPPLNHQIVIVEGLYLLLTPEAQTSIATNEQTSPSETHHVISNLWADISKLFDLKIFLRAPYQQMSMKRLAARHRQAWNWEIDEALKRANGSDRINAELVEKTESNADIVVDSIDDPVRYEKWLSQGKPDMTA